MGARDVGKSALFALLGMVLGFVLGDAISTQSTAGSDRQFMKCPATGFNIGKLIDDEGFDINEVYRSGHPNSGESVVVVQIFNEVCGAENGFDGMLAEYFLTHGGRVSIEDLGRILTGFKENDLAQAHERIIRLLEDEL